MAQKFTTNDEEIIQDYQKWFNFYLNLPLYTAIIWALGCIVTGITLAVAEEPAFLLLALGAVLSPIVYWCTKIATSGFILNIFYLKKISISTQTNNPQSSLEQDELPEI